MTYSIPKKNLLIKTQNVSANVLKIENVFNNIIIKTNVEIIL